MFDGEINDRWLWTVDDKLISDLFGGAATPAAAEKMTRPAVDPPAQTQEPPPKPFPSQQPDPATPANEALAVSPAWDPAAPRPVANEPLVEVREIVRGPALKAEITPADLPPQPIERELLAHGLERWEAGASGEAKTLFEKALDQNQLCAPALQSLAQLAIERGDCAAALDLEKALLGIEQCPAEIAYNIGVLRDQAGQALEATAAYRRALTAQPDFAEALFNLGCSAHASGETGQAVEYWRAALAQKPELAAGYFDLI